MKITDVTPEDIEIAVLSSMKSAEDVRRGMAAGLDEESWQVDQHARAWEYLTERAKLGESASKADVLHAVGVELVDGITDEDTFLDDLVRRTVWRKATQRIIERGQHLERDPQHTVELLIGDLSDIVRASEGHTKYADADIEVSYRRVLEMADRRERGEMVGVRTGLYALDSNGYNWMSGDVVGVQGPLNVGKSALLLWFCVQGYFYDRQKVLFLTPESTISDVEMRYWPMLARLLGMELSNRELRMGKFDRDLVGEFVKQVKALGRKDWIIRDAGNAGSFEPSDIIQLAHEHRPGILAIDGVHLLGGEGKSWEKMQDLSKAVKGLAQQMGLVVIGGTQVQRDAVMAADTPAKLGESAYGMAFLESCNKVISLAQKKGDPMQRVWTLEKNRDGERIEKKQYIRFDIDRGDIGDLEAHRDSEGMIDFVRRK